VWLPGSAHQFEVWARSNQDPHFSQSLPSNFPLVPLSVPQGVKAMGQSMGKKTLLPFEPGCGATVCQA
jgi:hypothetical protein